MLYLFSLLSLLISSALLALGLTLTLQSRDVSGNIGTKIYIIYGPSLLDGIRNLLPNIPGKESLVRELDILIHDVMVNDIGDTLNYTIYVSGILAASGAIVQIVANIMLLFGAVIDDKKWIPNNILTRIFYLSTFWGSIDAYRKTLVLDEMAVFLV